jgi:PUA domain protein
LQLTSSPPSRFIPKEDIATSTSIKSSIQRQIRSKLLAQIPLLSAPAHPAVVEPAGEGSDDESEEEERVVSTRKKGAKKEEKEKEKEKNKGGKGGKGRREVVVEVEEDEGEGEEDVLTLLDVLWPKKEGLTLVKW